MNSFKDLFISYGRRESLGFVGRLHQQLKLAGYDAWFDKVNIPDGDDYTQRIKHGIESAHNFVYVMAPRCMISPYCLIELEYARLLGKRVIPINHLVIFETASQELSDGDKQVMSGFYQHYNLPDQNIQTTQDVLDRSHALIGRTDWLDAKENLSDDDCQRLAQWAQPYENHWAKHDELDYLQAFEFPVFGETIDTLNGVVERITAVLERQKDYVHKHSEILSEAIKWQQNQKATQYLLVGKERTTAEEWLLTEFLPPKQPPCQPSALVCEFICEARKNAENLMTDIFICYDVHHDKTIRDSVVQSLSRYAKTTWTHDRDIQKGYDYECAIEQGIENADNFFYFLSPHSIASEYCQRELEHALKYNKRIVPLLIIPTPESDILEALRGLQYIDFTDNTCQADYDSDIDDILNILRQEQEYYEQHKVLLARALKWETQNHKPSFLLRGHHLENAQTWLRLNDNREQHPLLALHKQLITASEAAKGQLGTEVFISYSRKDGDFARPLNLALQEAGKTTWFDQESISTGVDFETEIFKGIASSDNFIFVISPDAVQSDYCEREVNYAASQHKRFITVLHRETDPTTMPKALRLINWIDFANSSFEKSFLELVQAIELDREHAHQHTLLQQRATEWDENSQCSDFLLNITACANAEQWLKTATEEQKQPKPTTLQQDFIQQSRKAIDTAERKARKRRNIIFSAVTGGMVFAIILAIFAFIQMNKAEKAQAKAEEAQAKAEVSEQTAKKAQEKAETSEQAAKEQAKIALVEKLGAQAVLATQLPSASNGSYERALLLAAQAFKEKDNWTTRSNLLRVLQAQKQLKFFLHGHAGPSNSVAFSPDGNLLASGSNDATVRLWDVRQKKTHGEPLHDSITGSMHVTSKSVYHVAFSSDGNTLAWVDNSSFLLWNVKNRKIILDLINPYITIFKLWPATSMAFSSNSNIFALGNNDNNTVRLYSLKQSKLSSSQANFSLGEPLVGHSEGVNSVAFSPDGKILATASSDNTVRLWDTKQKKSNVLKGHLSSVYSVTFSPDGKILASAGNDNTIRLWDVKQKKSLDEPLTGHSDVVLNVAFSPDGKILASAGRDNTIRLWDVKQRKLLSKFTDYFNVVYSIAFNPKSNTLASASSYNNAVILWNIKQKERLSNTLTAHSSSVNSIAFSPDGKTLASASSDNTVRLWDVIQKKTSGEPLIDHYSSVYSVAFSPNGNILASASADNSVILWDVKTRKSLGKPLVHSSSVHCVAFSPNGNILASRDNSTVRLWDVTHRKLLDESSLLETRQVKSVAFSPDSNILAGVTARNNTFYLWDIKQRKLKLIGKFSNGNPLDFLLSVAFSPDGNILAYGGSDTMVRLWDVKQRKLLGVPLTGHFGYIISVAFSPDGNTLASASLDGTIRLWNVRQRKPFGEPLKGHSGQIINVAFSTDSKILASASNDGTVRLWDIDPESWANKACAIVNRNFSHEEWQKYMGNDRPHEKTCPDLPKDTLGAIELTKEALALVREAKKLEREQPEVAKAKFAKAKEKFAKAREWDENVVFGDEGLFEQDYTN